MSASPALPSLGPQYASLVVGASGGIGLALTRRLLDDPDCAQVFAASRNGRAELDSLLAAHPTRLRTLKLDLGDEGSIRAAASHVRALAPALHLLINTAGVLHDEQLRPERRLEDLRVEALHRAFAVNAIGPILLARHFAPLLTHARRAVFASLSARVGSIADNRLGGWYAYRASKAAQNQLLRTLAVEMTRRAPRLSVLALHPGTVDTALSKPFQSGVAADNLFAPDHAAMQLLRVIDAAQGSGRFLAWDGSEIPW